MAQQYLRAADIAAELGVSRTRAYEILRQCTRLVTGRTVRVSRINFENWKRRHEVVADEPPPTKPRGRAAAAPVETAPSPFEARLMAPWKPRRKRTEEASLSPEYAAELAAYRPRSKRSTT